MSNTFYLKLHADQTSYGFINHNYVQFYLMRRENQYYVIYEDSEKAKKFFFPPTCPILAKQELDIGIVYIKRKIVPYVSQYIDGFWEVG